ncbi:MAG: DUF934 domain-containing protein [Pseudomonadota bacterium]
MPLRDDAGPLDDRWTRVEPGEDLAERSLLGFTDADERGPSLAGIDPARLGLHVANDVQPDALVPWFDKISLISIDFPSFADGRGFSIARALRQRGYTGRLRARGPVIADQYAYLRACGFDEVETPEAVSNRQPEAQWAEISAVERLRYQRGYPGARNILDARREARG